MNESTQVTQHRLKQFTVYHDDCYTYYLRQEGCSALQSGTYRARRGPRSDTCFSERRWHLECDWPNLVGMTVVGTFDKYDDAYKCIEKHFLANGNPTFPSNIG